MSRTSPSNPSLVEVIANLLVGSRSYTLLQTQFRRHLARQSNGQASLSLVGCMRPLPRPCVTRVTSSLRRATISFHCWRIQSRGLTLMATLKASLIVSIIGIENLLLRLTHVMEPRHL